MSELAAELRRLAKKKRLDDLEGEWMTVVEGGTEDAGELLVVLQMLVKRDEQEMAESLFWFLLSTTAEKGVPEAALEVARQGAHLLPESSVLRREVTGLYRKIYPDHPEIEPLTDVTVGSRRTPLDVAIPQADALLALTPGTYVADRLGGTPSRVKGIDTVKKALVIETAREDRAYLMERVANLVPLGEDDFGALAIFERERLAGIADEDPVRLVEMALRSAGTSLSTRELKPVLLEIISAENWSRWWSKARKRIARSETIEMSSGSQPTFALRDRPITYEERFREQFDAAQTAADRLAAVLGYLDAPGEDEGAANELCAQFAEGLRRSIDESDPVAALATLGAFEMVSARIDGAAPPEVDPATLIDGVDLRGAFAAAADDALVRCALDCVRERLPDRWGEVAVAAMPVCSFVVCDWVAARLSDEDLAAAASAVAVAGSDLTPAMLWLWKSACAPDRPETLASIDRPELTIRFLLAVARAARTDAKSLLSQVRQIISSKKFATFENAVSGVDAEQAEELKLIIERNAGLSELLRAQMLEWLSAAHPAAKDPGPPPWEEETLYTTKEGLARRQAELADIIDVKLLHVAREIGRAAEMGDLSENAEFTAALEERDRLTERAQVIQNELAVARVIPQGMPDGDTIAIGSRVTAKDLSSGETVTLTFLGPWETDPDNGIYSYRAPLSFAFMGAKVGDTVSFGEGAEARSWEILELASALE